MATAAQHQQLNGPDQCAGEPAEGEHDRQPLLASSLDFPALSRGPAKPDAESNQGPRPPANRN